MKRYTIHFAGHVQGVGFRYTVRNVAMGFPVAGFVRNLSDGRVQVVAEGEDAVLKAFVEGILEAMRGYIDDHKIEQGEATGEFGSPVAGGLTIRR